MDRNTYGYGIKVEYREKMSEKGLKYVITLLVISIIGTIILPFIDKEFYSLVRLIVLVFFIYDSYKLLNILKEYLSGSAGGFLEYEGNIEFFEDKEIVSLKFESGDVINTKIINLKNIDKIKNNIKNNIKTVYIIDRNAKYILDVIDYKELKKMS